MSSSDQPNVNLSHLPENRPIRLEASVYSQAEPKEREILDTLAKAIESTREHLKTPLGLAEAGILLDRPRLEAGPTKDVKNWPVKLHPAASGQVDQLTWEDLLLWYFEPIFEYCIERGYHEQELIMRLVVLHCAPVQVAAIYHMWSKYLEVLSTSYYAVRAMDHTKRNTQRRANEKRTENATAKKRSNSEEYKAMIKNLAEPYLKTKSKEEIAILLTGKDPLAGKEFLSKDDKRSRKTLLAIIHEVWPGTYYKKQPVAAVKSIRK